MKPETSEASRRLARMALVVGLSLGVLGTLWIFYSHRWPKRAVHYHVPLAIVFGAFATYVVHAPLGRDRWSMILGTALSLALVACRMAFAWPFSGHGVLASYIALLSPWRTLTVAALLILPQAVITKFVRAEDPESVLFGAFAGAALAALVRARITRSSRTRSA